VPEERHSPNLNILSPEEPFAEKGYFLGLVVGEDKNKY
jgi:hypothetical protein